MRGANHAWRRVLAADPPTIEDAFLVRTPESYGLGIMDDRVVRAHWRRLRSILGPALPRDLSRETWEDWRRPIGLAVPRNEPLRLALRDAHARLRATCERTILEPLPDEEERQAAYLRRPWPRVRRSSSPAHERFDPLSEERVAAAFRCHKFWVRQLYPAKRAMRAYACFLLAIGEPVPSDLMREMNDDLAEEIACIILAEEYSGYGDWTIRTGALRVFGRYVDPNGRHPLAHEFGGAFPEGMFDHEPVNVDTPHLWARGDGRDLDGFLLTPCGIRRADGTLLRMSVRERSYFGPDAAGGPPPTLVVRHASATGAPYSLVSIERPGAIVWGGPLPPNLAREAKQFIERNRAALFEHWRGETSSVELLRAVHDRL